MTPKLACADFTFPLLPHDKSLDLIAMLGFEGVDIGLFEGRSHLWPSRVFADLKGSAKELKHKLRDRGLALADVFLQTAPDFVSIAPNHPDLFVRRQARDWFARTVEFALECGGRHISALPGVTFDDEPEAESYERCRDELAWRCQTASCAGRHVFGRGARRLDRADARVGRPAGAVGPGLTLTLDYTHFTRGGVPDQRRGAPDRPRQPLPRPRCTARAALQASFKENVIDYGRVLDVMRQVGYAGYVGVEYVWIDWEHCNEVDNLSETILMRDFLRERGKSISR